MGTMIMRGVLAAAAVTVACAMSAAPALADNGSDSGSVNAASNWNFTADAVCRQEVAVVPALGDYVSDDVNNCSNGNVIDHTAQHLAGGTVDALSSH
ncbi:hypothetical protein AQJ30_07415 [Streptomyces longwoodensis]|uniref:Chaplin domain-containing protein n=2 Tax=Streptomyces longwoodensis TaxID=68231 RepID=A0A101R2F6_9ACTN|nr:hypothetical protein AQJ30_07415 [Streptomyces longwoodensis]